jgi:hypothetical protein
MQTKNEDFNIGLFLDAAKSTKTKTNGTGVGREVGSECSAPEYVIIFPLERQTDCVCVSLNMIQEANILYFFTPFHEIPIHFIWCTTASNCW